MSVEDDAQELELRQWEALNLGRGDKPLSYASGEPGYGPPECEECDAEMHPVRRSYGFRVCVHCKEFAEAEARMMGRPI